MKLVKTLGAWATTDRVQALGINLRPSIAEGNARNLYGFLLDLHAYFLGAEGNGYSRAAKSLCI